jgi:uncharacterized membrane protein YjdF
MTSVPFSYYRTPLILLGIVSVVCAATVWSPPAGRISWLLEVGPGLAGIAVLIALLAAPDVGTAFLGSQGDIWDAQWDMFLALVGAMAAVPLFYRLHDRSMARLKVFLS